MTRPVSIRLFRYPEDYPAARALWESMEKGLGIGRSDAPQEIEKKVLRDPDLFLVAEADGVMVGTVIGGFDGRRGLIYHLAVAAPHRRQGLATLLMDEIEGRLRSKGCLKCYLLLLEGNGEAVRFYERRGWSRMDAVRLYGKELA
ncbi:MAG: GNAT family N-acetyltransferase [Bacteroidota bacterium]